MSSPKTPKTPVLMDATQMMKGLKPEDIKALLKDKIAEGMHEQPALGPLMQKRVNALKNIQVDLLKCEAKFYDELHEMEMKYVSINAPFYEKRRQLIAGEIEPSEQEGIWALDVEDEKDGLKTPALENGEKVEEEKGVKNFWLETFQSFRITSEIIQEYDEEILGYLMDVQVKLKETKPYGYDLEFYFAENPFFTNKVLTKSYILKSEVDVTDPLVYDGPDLDICTGCTINWNEGKNVCVKIVKKKIKPRNKKQQARIVTKEEKQDSFFNFFDTPKVPTKSTELVTKKSESSVEGSEHDAEHDAELYMIADFEIGQYLKEKIIPKAILFYTGEGVDDEFDEDDYDEEEDDEEDGESDEENESDEDDSEPEDSNAKGKGKVGKPKNANIVGKPKNGEPTPSECKQN